MQPTVLAPVLSSIPPQSTTPFTGKAQNRSPPDHIFS